MGDGETISSGGELLVSSGGVDRAATIASGGMDDLGGFGYSSGATLSFTEAPSLTSGTLGVANGALTVKLTLLGSYATSNFALSDDGHGGTFVTHV